MTHTGPAAARDDDPGARRQAARFKPSGFLLKDDPPWAVSEPAERELDVFRLIARGYSKLNLRDRVQAADTRYRTLILEMYC